MLFGSIYSASSSSPASPSILSNHRLSSRHWTTRACQIEVLIDSWSSKSNLKLILFSRCGKGIDQRGTSRLRKRSEERDSGDGCGVENVSSHCLIGIRSCIGTDMYDEPDWLSLVSTIRSSSTCRYSSRAENIIHRERLRRIEVTPTVILV